MPEQRFVIARDVAWRVLDDQVFAVTLDGNMHHIDTVTGVFIWERLDDGVDTIPRLVEAVLDAFQIDRNTAEADLGEFLHELVGKKVLELAAR